MLCPDCNFEMERKRNYHVGVDGGYVELDDLVYKCPNCGIEVEVDPDDM